MTLLIPTHRPPTTPGEMLVEEFLKPLNITQMAFAERIGVSYPRLNEIVNGRRGISPDTAIRFSRALGTSPDFWLNLQHVLDLYQVLQKKGGEMDHIEPIVANNAASVEVARATKRGRVHA